MDFAEVLKQAQRVKEEPARPPGTRQEVEDAYLFFTTPFTFKPGDVIKWKPYCRGARWPAYDEPCVVVEVLDEVILSKSANEGSQYFRERNDIIVGLMLGEDTNDDQFCLYHMDSRRFCPFDTVMTSPTENKEV
jgi:hypothetical protein